MPGRNCYVAPPDDQHLRLCFAMLDEDKLEQGIAHLSEALAAAKNAASSLSWGRVSKPPPTRNYSLKYSPSTPGALARPHLGNLLPPRVVRHALVNRQDEFVVAEHRATRVTCNPYGLLVIT